MLILNKNKFLVIFFSLFLSLVFLFLSFPALALDTTIRQVKLKNSPVIYYLNHKAHTRKAYVNSTAYLSYGNKWSDVKVVSQSELNKWSEAVLFKVSGTSGIYYVKNGKRSAIHDLADLNLFNLSKQPISEVSETDLSQYKLATYEEIGLRKKVETTYDNLLHDNLLPPPPNDNSVNTSLNKILVSSDAIISTSTILTTGMLAANTRDNLLGIFNFEPFGANATITSLTFNLSGVYNSDMISGMVARDNNNFKYEANVNWQSNGHKLAINFYHPLKLSVGVKQSVKIYSDLLSCPSCNNQTMYLELKDQSSVSSTLPVRAAWPLKGTSFKIVDGSSTFASVRAEEQSLASQNLSINNGSRVIGKFKIFEDSGRDEALVKRLLFSNSGSVSKDDWNNFRLLKDGIVVSRVSEINSEGRIDFNINALRVSSSSTAELSVSADLKANHTTSSTFNLELETLEAIGKTYNLNLFPKIKNLEESYSLN